MTDSFHKSSEVENIITMCSRFSRNASRADTTAFLNSIRRLFDVKSACLAQLKTDTLRPMAGYISVGLNLTTIEREFDLFRNVEDLAEQNVVTALGSVLFSMIGIRQKRATALILHQPERCFDKKACTSLRLIHALIQPELAQNLTALSPITTGPRRVEQVCNCLVNGLSDKQIAAELGISPHTVHVYVKQLFKLRNVNSRVELLCSHFKGHVSPINALKYAAYGRRS